jgi:NAD(P)-dependent dehydrogenase (short-subunit alcohol dehydrogenase family)
MSRSVLILGASSDIGIAVCKRFLASGDRVVAHSYRGERRLNDLGADASQLKSFVADFGDATALTASIERMRPDVESCDVLISAAAQMRATPFTDATAEDLIEAFRINVLPGLLFMQAVAPRMVQRHFGRILHLSSIGVRFRGGASSFAYALSKHATEFLPQDINVWAASNVLVNVLRVGVTDTRIHQSTPGKSLADRAQLIPVGRAATPDEIAGYIQFYGSSANSFVTGEVITVAGGE